MYKFKRSLIDLITINDISNKTDEELEDLMLKCVEDFRKCNPKYICPICFEESYYETFLVSYCNCKHKCCKNCWADNIRTQYKYLQKPFHCFECSEKIQSLFTILDNKILTLDEINDYSLRISRLVFKDDIIRCPNCKIEYFRSKVNCRCPQCYYYMCTNCLKIEHDSLNMNCNEFEKFMLTNQYIKLLQSREKQRIIELNLTTNKQSFSNNLQKELISEINIRKEKQRQRELMKNEVETAKWLNENTKQCPRCNVNIIKNGGCNHMTCENCNYEFCWICMEKYTTTHFSSTSKCKQFDDGFRGDDYGLEQYA